MTTTTLERMLRDLKLPGMRHGYQELGLRAEQQGWSFAQYLEELAEVELAERDERRIARNLKASKLTEEKTLATLKLDRLEPKLQRQLPRLCQGDFVERAENVLVFGLPGRGKTHLVCAIGHELLRRVSSSFILPKKRG